MEDAVQRELDELREENRILRASLTEVRPPQPESPGSASDNPVSMFFESFGSIMETINRKIEPGKEKLTERLSKQMEKNPAPMMLAAAGAGFIMSKVLRRAIR